jgi:very-short-patch-repair endonuclease
VPEGLSALAEQVLVAAGEWLAHRGGFGVWLTGAPLLDVDRVEAMTVCLPGEVASLVREVPDSLPVPARPAVRFPPLAGLPHPASRAEQALESALAARAWTAGRAWNQTYQSHLLANPIRVDLLWRAERCVVEVDGVEHCAPLMFAADRRRDVQLQLDGYAVLRFTNAQVINDIEAVVSQIERFIQGRRRGTLEGQRHAG